MTRLLIAMLAAVAMLAGGQQAVAVQTPDAYANPRFASQLDQGLSAFYARDFELARRHFAAALALAPGEALALAFDDASAVQLGIGKITAVAAEQERQAARSPHDGLAQCRLAYAYLFMAQSDASRDADARRTLGAALSANPHLAAARVGMGIYHYNHGSRSRAKTEFLAALAMEPRNVLAREYLAAIYQTDLGDPNTALGYLVDVPNVVPRYADAYYHLGSIMDDLGQYDAAIAFLKTGIDLDGGHVGEAGQQGLPLLGDIYLKIHRLDDAKRAYTEAVVFGEEPDYAQMQLDKIKRGQIR